VGAKEGVGLMVPAPGIYASRTICDLRRYGPFPSVGEACVFAVFAWGDPETTCHDYARQKWFVSDYNEGCIRQSIEDPDNEGVVRYFAAKSIPVAKGKWAPRLIGRRVTYGQVLKALGAAASDPRIQRAQRTDDPVDWCEASLAVVFELRRPAANPLSPLAHACESAPCALARPVGGLPLDDRAGVHVTDDWGLALRYAAFKASRSESVAVVLTYDMKGLKLESDFDAKVDQEHTMLESAWYLREFDILSDPENPDYDRLADVLDDGDSDSDDEGPPWSVEHELIKQSKTPIRRVIAEHLREGGAEAARALAAVVEDKAPLDYHAEAIHQWRTFSEVGDDRLLKVEVVKPFNGEVSDEVDDEVDSDACPATFTLDDLDGIADAMETKTLYSRKPPRGAVVYYHGTDLTRAQEILRDAGIELVNPWAPCVQPGD
jgi:hypothetical protein